MPVADSRGETWTHRYWRNDVYSRVDHIMVSKSLQAVMSSEVGVVYDGPGVTVASDHRPVMVELRLMSESVNLD